MVMCKVDYRRPLLLHPYSRKRRASAQRVTLAAPSCRRMLPSRCSPPCESAYPQHMKMRNKINKQEIDMLNIKVQRKFKVIIWRRLPALKASAKAPSTSYEMPSSKPTMSCINRRGDDRMVVGRGRSLHEYPLTPPTIKAKNK